MEASSLLLIAISIFVIVAVKSLIRSRIAYSDQKNGGGGGASVVPSGPSRIWILAQVFILRRTSMGFAHLLRDLRSIYGPMISIRLSRRPTIFVFDRRLAHEALIQKGPAIAGRPPPALPSRLINSSQLSISSADHGLIWRLLRRNLTAEVLHPSRVRLFSDARRWVLHVLLDRLRSESADGRAVEVYEAFQFAVFCLLVYMCFGVKLGEEEVRKIEEVQRDLLGLFRKLNVFAVIPVAVAKVVFRRRWRLLLSLRRRQREIFFPLIEARREMKKKKRSSEESEVVSYLDSLLDLRLPEESDGGGGEGGRKLTDDEMASLCSEFLVGGTDTTATALQWTLANLVKHPEIQSRLAEELAVAGAGAGEVQEDVVGSMPYLRAVIMEALRLHPPGHFVLPHAAAEDVELAGGRWKIPKGAMVNFSVVDMGRDGELWTSPEEFRPARFMAGGEGEGVDVTGTREITMMPFGAGRRICPGMNLAMLHLEFFVANLIKEFVWETEVEDGPVDLGEKLEFTVVMNRPLRARIRPRNKPVQ